MDVAGIDQRSDVAGLPMFNFLTKNSFGRAAVLWQRDDYRWYYYNLDDPKLPCQGIPQSVFLAASESNQAKTKLA